MIANLVALDLTAVFAESWRLGTAGDGLAWLGDGDAVAAPALARLISTGARAGLATVVSAACGAGSVPAVEQIAALANVVVIRGPGDPGLAGFPLGAALAADEFALLARGPGQQVVPRARFVPGGRRDRRAAGPALPGLGVRAGAPGSGARRRGAHPARPGTAGRPAGCWPSTVRKRRLARPLKAGAAAGAALAGLTAALGAAGALNPALTATGIAVFLAITVACARGVWRGARDLRARVAAEEQRVARARAARASRLSGWQDEHARRLRDWEARGRAFQAQPQWYGVALPTGIDRLDVAGGTLAGWSALTGTLAGLRLAAGGEVTVLDLSEGAVAQELLAMACEAGVSPLVWGAARGPAPAGSRGRAARLRWPTSWPPPPRSAIRPARPTRRRTAPSWNVSPGSSAGSPAPSSPASGR